MRRLWMDGAKGSPARLPFGLLLASALLSGGCSRAESPANDFPKGGAVLWEVPEVPTGITMTVNARAVDAEVLRGYLLPVWAERWDDFANLEEATREFFADPQPLLTPLVRGILLLHEAEQRWPTLEEEVLQEYDAAMRRDTGAIYESMLRRLGESGMRAHQEREIRKRMLLAAFGEEADPVTEDEVYQRYGEMMAAVEDPAALARRGIDFNFLSPQIRADLENTRAVELQEAWLDHVLPTARVSVVLPGGRGVTW